MMFYQRKEMMWEVMHVVDMSYCHLLIKNLLLSNGSGRRYVAPPDTDWGMELHRVNHSHVVIHRLMRTG